MTNTIDRHIATVIEKYHQRAQMGKTKYGVTLERKDLTTIQWLIHAQEEAMDLAGYLQVLIDNEYRRTATHSQD